MPPAASPLSFRQVLALSRPRFWIYVLGPYLVGLAAGAASLGDFSQLRVLIFGLFFTLPANLLIYGVNDIFDYETDVLNAKKTGYETLVPPAQRSQLWRCIALLNIPFALALFAFGLSTAALTAMAAFLFFSLFYSMPPIRAKARPVLDSMFNVLYICPAAFAYFLIGGARFSWTLFFAAWLWAMAMHAYSAVPDISSDRAASLSTIATRFRFRGTLWLCLVLYAVSALLAFSTLGVLAPALGAVYVALMLRSLSTQGEAELLGVYRFFPMINTLSGMALFFAVFLYKFPPRFF